MRGQNLLWPWVGVCLALGGSAQASEEEIPSEVPSSVRGLLAALEDPNDEVVVAALVEAKGWQNGAFALLLPSSTKSNASRISVLLSNPDKRVRSAAARVLVNMGAAAKEHAPLLLPLMKDPDPHVRLAAARVLGAMGAATPEHASLIVALIKEWELAEEAAWTLRAMGAADKQHVVPLLLPLMSDPDWNVSNMAANALMASAPIDIQHCAEILAMVYKDSSRRPKWLMTAHISAGGAPHVERVLRWLAGRTSSEFPKQLSLEEARSTLRAFADFWPHTEKHPALRDDLAQQIARVVNLARNQWEHSDIKLLELHEANLKALQPMHAETIRAAITLPERWHALRTFAWLWSGHIFFWLLLLSLYPRSPQVQAFFFWNPWVRRIMGFGYVGLLLTWVPFLRRHLLSPFQHLLLADAQLEHFSSEPYFAHSAVLLQSSGRREPLLGAIPRLRGQIVLEGASGLGKSMFIKHLLRTSKRLSVFLPAERCKPGVIEAIQTKLEGHAKDTSFLLVTAHAC